MNTIIFRFTTSEGLCAEVQLGEGEALPLAVDATHERDLIALVARSFWALAVKARTVGGVGGVGRVGGGGGGGAGGNKVMPTPHWSSNPPTSKLLREYNYER